MKKKYSFSDHCWEKNRSMVININLFRWLFNSMTIKQNNRSINDFQAMRFGPGLPYQALNFLLWNRPQMQSGTSYPCNSPTTVVPLGKVFLVGWYFSLLGTGLRFCKHFVNNFYSYIHQWYWCIVCCFMSLYGFFIKLMLTSQEFLMTLINNSFTFLWSWFVDMALPWLPKESACSLHMDFYKFEWMIQFFYVVFKS